MIANKEHAATCALVGSLLDSSALRWRHHGIGLLQAYMLQGSVEYRLHVWHPELRFVDDDSGMIHDHRFRLDSWVLCGAIHDTKIVLHPNDKGWILPRPVYQVWEVENARKTEESGEGWVRKVDSELYTISETPNIYAEGARYGYPSRMFHRSEVKDLTVTLCTKTHHQDAPARILSRVGATPKHGIGAPMRQWAGSSGIADPRERYLRWAKERLIQIAKGAR
jgi:hypothetical protein